MNLKSELNKIKKLINTRAQKIEIIEKIGDKYFKDDREISQEEIEKLGKINQVFIIEKVEGRRE